MAKTPAIEVEVAIVDRGPLLVTLDEEGRTRVRERIVVTAPAAGELHRIALEPGDRVRRGEPLATLTPVRPALLDDRARSEATASLRAAEAAADRADAERSRVAASAAFAAQQRDRARRLLDAGAIAGEEFEARVAEARALAEALRAADFAAAQARQEVQVARARLTPAAGGARPADLVVTAPVDGIVLKRFHESARPVALGEPLLELGDADRLEIVTDLLSADAVGIALGAEVVIDQWGGTQPLAGRVRRVEPAGFTKISALGVEEQRVNVIIDFTAADEAAALGDGYRVEVRIVQSRLNDVLKVPTGALFREGADWAVFAVRDGRARVTSVTIGARNGREAQVLAGLDAGDCVIVYAPDTVTDNVRVVARR